MRNALPSRHTNMVGITLGVVALQALALLCFVLALTELEPKNVRVGVVAPLENADNITYRLETARSADAFDITRYGSPASAREAIRDREVSGALVAQPNQPPRLLIATAASPQVTQLLTEVGPAALNSSGGQLQIQDLRPLDPDDPAGTALLAMIFPFVLTSVAAGGLFAIVGAALPGWVRLGLLTALSGLTGLVGSGVITGFGILPDENYGAIAGVLIFVVFVIATTTAGLGRRLGHAGYTLAGLVYVLVGLIGSGGAVSQQFQPGLWRVVGPYLPPGAAVETIRNVTYFDAAEIWQPLFVLGIFAVLGVALMAAPKPQPGGAHAPGAETIAPTGPTPLPAAPAGSSEKPVSTAPLAGATVSQGGRPPSPAGSASTTPDIPAGVANPAAGSEDKPSSNTAITGRVYRADGRPAAAVMTLTDFEGGGLVDRTRTDTDGAYRLRAAPGATYLLVCSPDVGSPRAELVTSLTGPVTHEIVLEG